MPESNFYAEMPPVQSRNFPGYPARMYKIEMCKNWTEVGYCRYGKKCQYAHGCDELNTLTPMQNS